MAILSIHFGEHDTTAVVADDYDILSAVQAERLTRVKGDGRMESLPATIDEALRVAGKTRTDIAALAASRTKFAAHHHIWPPMKTVKYAAARLLGMRKQKYLSMRYQQIGVADHRRVFRARAFMDSLGLPAATNFYDYNHHSAHALSALFFTDWDNALLYTADGGGDLVFYSARHISPDSQLHALYGGDEEIATPPPIDSIGLAYGYMTKALGYKINRHEGKLTGLAAYGKPTIYDKLARRFSVAEDGRVNSDFADYKAMESAIAMLARNANPEDAAASIQLLLEDLITRSIGVYLRRTGARAVGLAGGVFANVSLNRRIAELPGVEEIFVFPGMGDEGIAVGGLYEYLLHRDGLRTWLSKRRRLNNVYWGGAYDGDIAAAFAAPDIAKLPGAPAEVAAELLAAGKIVALFCGRMEFGPRALGARSILANPADNDINKTLNKRLARTEFMPFAPCVLEEDVDDVFEATAAAKYAMRFMTVTCHVRQRWRAQIPAVIHIDDTARPQIVRAADNPLYADILRRFKQKTGLPALINTSFNAHEEPLIHAPAEALRALRDGRVDYVATPNGVYSAKQP